MSAPPHVHRAPHLGAPYSPCTHPAEKSRSHLQPGGGPQVAGDSRNFLLVGCGGCMAHPSKKMCCFLGAILALLGPFSRLREGFHENQRFSGCQPRAASGEAGGCHPLPHPRQPRQGPSEDVFGCTGRGKMWKGKLWGGG